MTLKVKVESFPYNQFVFQQNQLFPTPISPGIDVLARSSIPPNAQGKGIELMLKLF